MLLLCRDVFLGERDKGFCRLFVHVEVVHQLDGVALIAVVTIFGKIFPLVMNSRQVSRGINVDGFGVPVNRQRR